MQAVQVYTLPETDPFFDDILEAHPYPFLYSPVTTPISTHPELGKVLARTCSKKGYPVVFARGHGITGWEAFYGWMADPTMKIGDLRDGPIFWPRFCLVSERQNDGRPPRTIEKVLEIYNEEIAPFYLTNPYVKGRLESMTKHLSQYRLIETYAYWGIFIFDANEPIADGGKESL
jgi:hypothetical protein